MSDTPFDKLPHFWRNPRPGAALEALETAKHYVEFTCENFDEPDDDWNPVMFCIGRGDTGNTIVAFDPAFMGDPDAKDKLADEVMPALLKQTQAVAVATVFSTWHIDVRNIAKLDGISEEEARVQWETFHAAGGMPSQHPARQEQVLIAGLSAVEEHHHWAPILRHDGKPPTLAPWIDVMADPDGLGGTGSITGRFIDPLRYALRPQG